MTTQSTGSIGRWHGAGLMATTLLGTGVFILPQLTIDTAGSGALWTWLLLTVAIIPVTFVFGRLSSRFPHAGGPAHFVEKAFGQLAGRCVGLSFLLLIPIGGAAAIIITYQFLAVLIDFSGAQEIISQLALILLIFIINLQGMKVSAKIQFFLTLLIVATVLAMVFFSPFSTTIPLATTADTIAQLRSIMDAAGIAFWSFLGVEAMSHLATDFRNPKRDMLPAMMIGTVLVGIIYILCTYLLLTVPNHGALGFVDVFDALLGGYGAQVIGLLGAASGLAAINVYLRGASKLLYSFSEEQVLPPFFHQISARDVPIRALSLITAAIAVAICFSYFFNQQLEQLISWTNGVFVFIYSATMLAAFRLLSKKYLPMIIVSCLFFAAIAYSIGSHMLYTLLILSFLLPVLYWQKAFLAQRSAQRTDFVTQTDTINK